MLATKSIHSPIDESDDLRILVSRFRGRRIPKSRYNVWMANLGPSEPLLKGFKSGRIAWKDYVPRYKKELFTPAALDAENRTIKNHGQKFTLRLIKELARHQPVTLLCQCAEEEQHCHRRLLKNLILSKAV